MFNLLHNLLFNGPHRSSRPHLVTRSRRSRQHLWLWQRGGWRQAQLAAAAALLQQVRALLAVCDSQHAWFLLPLVWLFCLVCVGSSDFYLLACTSICVCACLPVS